VGIGVQVDSPDRLVDSYYTAISSYNQKFYHPDEKLFVSSKTSLSLDIVYDPAYELSKILLQSPENAKTWVQTQFEHIRKHDATPVELVRYWGFKMSAEMYFLLNSLRTANVLNSLEDDAALWKVITSFESLDDLRDYILDNLDNLENSRSSLDQSLPMYMEVQRYIHLNCSEPLTLEMISQHVNLSVTYLCSIFKDATGKTINEYITDCRIHRAKRFLETTNMHINEIALASGYSSSSYFIKAFKKSTSVTPHEYRLAYKVV
jgi:two-component system response regulator YesN